MFTADNRIYRPVKRLCHEMLASLRPEGAVAYRAEFEFAAETAYTEALEAADILALERVSDRFFLTYHAARALEAAGDLRLDAAQFRAALQNFHTLLETYPADDRAEAGIDDTYLHVRIALCYACLGDRARADSQIETLGKQVGQDTAIRISGELVATKALGDLQVFDNGRQRRPGARTDPQPASPSGTPSESGILESELVPLWEFRFDEPRPYKPIRESSRRSGRFIVTQDGSRQASVQPDLFSPGTSALTQDGRITFLDHFRLRTHDALSGRMLRESDEALSEKLGANRPRARVATYDIGTARVIRRGDVLYTVLGPQPGTKGLGLLLDNRLVAYDADSLVQLWSSEAFADLANLTFLAAPTPFGDRLLVPVLDNETVSLQSIDAATGEPDWRVTVHRGGTLLSRPMSSPVVIDQGLAYLMSNAGAIAAIDAHIGELRWIRRYERVHPFRPRKLREDRQNQMGRFFGSNRYQELSRLPGFAPSDIWTTDGMVLFAPTDGGVLHCLDGATGEPIWMLNRHQRAPAGNLSRSLYIVGMEDGKLIVGGDYDVYCIDIATGVRLWRADLENIGGTSQWRGRGIVHAGHVLIPGDQEILARSLDAPESSPWRSMPIPELSIGRESLEGPFNVSIDGIYLTTSFAGGIATFSTVEDLLRQAERATAPEQRALYQAQAGDLLAAFQTLESIDLETIDSAPRLREIAARVLSIGSELALAMAAHDAEQEAVQILDRARTKLTTERDIKRWYLMRIEVFDALGDPVRVQEQQQELYRLMDGAEDEK